MRKFCFLLASMIVSLLGFQGYAQDTTPDQASITVTIDGQFYTFAAQDTDDPRNEAFTFG